MLWTLLAMGLVLGVLFFVLYELWQRKRSQLDDLSVIDEEEKPLIRRRAVGGALLSFQNICVPGRVHNASGDFLPGILV